MYKIANESDTPIYQHFNFPDDISKLDIQIIKNTLDHLAFIAEMSDDYNITRRELQVINDYKRKHNL